MSLTFSCAGSDLIICCNYLIQIRKNIYPSEYINSFFVRSFEETGMDGLRKTFQWNLLFYEICLPYDPTVREGNYTNREEISYRDEDYHIAPVGEKYEVFSNFLKSTPLSWSWLSRSVRVKMSVSHLSIQIPQGKRKKETVRKLLRRNYCSETFNQFSKQ